MNFTNFLGYSSIFALLISIFFMKSRKKFFLISSVGCIFLCFYAYKINSVPVLIFSGIIGIACFVGLFRVYNNGISFDIFEISPDEQVCKIYCEKNKQDIDKLFGIDAMKDAKNTAFVFRDNDIAGLIAYTKTAPNVARIYVDYVSPKYRDGASGKHFFSDDLSFWHKQKIEKLEVYAPLENYIPYLEKLGFKRSLDPATWIKEI